MTKKIFFTCVTSLLLFCTCLEAQSTDSLFIGRKMEIYSKLLNEDRKIRIYTPNITSTVVNDEKRYPVLYLLDGEAHFYATVGIIQQLSQANGNGILPEMIVVAIENTNRLRDLTPDANSIRNPEKTNPFVNFLSSELIPFVDKNFKTAPYRVLAGHSLGGLTTIDILTNHSKLFNAYIAIDPSMWYGNEMFLNNTISQLSRRTQKNTKLFIGIANTMPKGLPLSSLKTNKQPETQHIRSIFKLTEFLGKNNTGLQQEYVYYEKENHNSVPLRSIYDGLKFIFNYFPFDISEKEFMDSSHSVVTKIQQHYIAISRELGYRVFAPESLVNFLGYDALSKKQYGKAAACFQLNIEGYPNSSDVYSAYADLLAATGDTTTAIANYQKALAIKNDPSISRKLNGLQKKDQFDITPVELQKYQGIYTLEKYKIDIKLFVKDGKLWARVPGQPDDEFVPLSKHVFTVKGKQGYTITFEMQETKPVGFTSIQPNGIFKAVFKNE